MSSRKNIVWSLVLVAFLMVIGSTTRAEAQGRRRVIVRPFVVGAFYDPFYDPWYGQWGPYPYPYGYRMAVADSAVKLEVRPKEAEVYVDGYYAGVVDDFDGVFQRLRLPPGEHDIELYMDGYRTVHQRLYLTPDNTFKVKYSMERLAAGDVQEPRPLPPNPPMPPPGAQPMPGQPAPGQPVPMPPQGRGPGGRRMPPPPNMPPPQNMPPQPPPGNAQATEYGTLAIGVQPGGAEILVDGEPWRGAEGQDRLVIDVAEGQHSVEIRKPGYRTYVTGVEVRRGQTTPLNVSLRAQ